MWSEQHVAHIAIPAVVAGRRRHPPAGRQSLTASRRQRRRWLRGPRDRTTAEPGKGDTPNPDQVPPPAGLPVPTQLTINVVGLLGNLSFAPNPLQAAIGNIIVWTNNDFLPHDIVLDDGTPVGNLTPGQSSLPITLAAETVGYHCTIHPSMVGQITSMPTGEPVPTDPSRNPTPDPNRSPSPDPYGDGDDNGGDGYVDYY